MSVERTYEGTSRDGSLQEALWRALQGLDADLGEGGVEGAVASWVVTEIAGEYASTWAARSVKVKIAAKRIPPWELG